MDDTMAAIRSGAKPWKANVGSTHTQFATTPRSPIARDGWSWLELAGEWYIQHTGFACPMNKDSMPAVVIFHMWTIKSHQ